MTRCADCGAQFENEGDSCRGRFDVLLALDHSRTEPWGSRHGLAFASFALQHPSAFARSLDQSWTALHAIYVGGRPRDFVFRRLVSLRGQAPIEWNVPSRPQSPTAAPPFTIADLGDFDATTYPELVDRMCRASLAMWGATTVG